MEVLYYSETGKIMRRTTVSDISITFCSDSENRIAFTDSFGEHVWSVYSSLSYNIRDLLKESPVNFLGLSYKPVDVKAAPTQEAASNAVSTSTTGETLTPEVAHNIVVWYMHLSSSARAYAEHSYAAFASACKSCESASAERCYYFLSSWSKHEIDEIMEDVKRNTRLPDSVLN